MTHPVWGRLSIIKQLGRVRLTGKEVARGPGWDESTNSYIGVKIKTPTGTSWCRGQNYGYGDEHTFRKEDL